MEQIAGDERVSHIDVEEMESEETDDWDEVQVFNEIHRKLGIYPVRFGYMPEKLVFTGYEFDIEQRRAILFYKYNDQIVRYSMYMNDEDSSHGQIEPDKLIDEYEIKLENSIYVKVKEYSVKGYDGKRYIAEFEYKDAQYQLTASMEKEIFEKIIENFYFL